MKPTRWILGAVTIGLFLVWSNSFIATAYLLGGETAFSRSHRLSDDHPPAYFCLTAGGRFSG